MGRRGRRTHLENQVVGGHSWGRGWPGAPRRRRWLGAVCALGAACPVAAQDRPSGIAGRVVDRDTGSAVEGAAIALLRVRAGAQDSARAEAVTDRTGMFRFQRAASGDYELTVTHIAYGTFRDRVTLAPGNRVALRITLSPTAIALEPVTVEVLRAGTRRDRERGSARRRLAAEELAPLARSGDHLVNALARLLPGMRVRSGRSQPGQLVCLEFRNPASLAAPGCRTPVVIVDNVRQANALITLNTLPIAHIRSVETVGPGEAGVRFGVNASYGVILIETVAGGVPATPSGDIPSGIYGWELESEPYPWSKALGAAVTANTVGLLAGYALARPCLSFDNLSQHFADARCGRLGNTGARIVLYVAPQFGVGYLAGRVGATDLSRGSMWKNAFAGTIMAAPGIVLALTGEEDGFPGSTGIGILMTVVGAPLATVVADRLFRRVER